MLTDFTTDYLVVFEGPDGAGKTSTIKQLGLQAHHTGGPPKTPEEFRNRVKELPKTGVLDRWPPISEYAYGPLRPQGPFFDLKEFCNIARDEAAHRDWEIFVVFCFPPKEILLENLARQYPKIHKSESYIEVIKAQKHQIYHRYDAIVAEVEHSIGLQVYHHDYTTDPHSFLLAYTLTHPSFSQNPIFKRKA